MRFWRYFEDNDELSESARRNQVERMTRLHPGPLKTVIMNYSLQRIVNSFEIEIIDQQ
jgi:hypothetical protein